MRCIRSAGFVLVTVLCGALVAADDAPLTAEIDQLDQLLNLARAAARLDAEASDDKAGLAWMHAASAGMLQAVGDPRGDQHHAMADELLASVVMTDENAWNLRTARITRAAWTGDSTAMQLVLGELPARAHRLDQLWWAVSDGLAAYQDAAKTDFCDLVIAEWEGWIAAPASERVNPDWDEPAEIDDYDYMAAELLALAGRFDEARRVASHSTDPMVRAESQLVVATQLAWQGHEQAARQLLAETLATLKDQRTRPVDEEAAYTHDSVWSSVANVHAYLGEYQAAQRVIDGIQDVSMRVYALFDVADHHFKSGNMDLGNATIRQALALCLIDEDAQWAALDGLIVWGRWVEPNAGVTWIDANGKRLSYTPTSELYLYLATGWTEYIRRQQVAQPAASPVNKGL